MLVSFRRSMFNVRCSMFALSLLPACRPATPITGDPLVLPSTQPTNLLATHIKRPLTLRSTYELTPQTITYAEGPDYTLDAAHGTISRTPASRIPDFSKNTLFNQHNFNHAEHPGYGNLPFTVYASYSTSDDDPLHVFMSSRFTTAFPPRAAAKLRSGSSLHLLAYGDSITAGGEVSRPDLQYPALYAAYLRHKFPRATITLENVATGGDTTRQGLARLQEKVLSKNPDLVLVAFGMNDHNLPSVGGVPVAEFETNLVEIVHRIDAQTHAECILLSCFEPNRAWAFGTHNMAQYAAATRHAAQTTNSSYADVFSLFSQVFARKDQSSLLANNINHPNDFGHYLYLEALKQLKF